MDLVSLLLTDFYKVGHVFQYPPNTQMVYSNLTPRNSRIPGVDHMVFFGLQYFIQKYLIDDFDENFFHLPWTGVISQYSRIMRECLGGDLQSYEHIKKLHALGYLPIEIKAVPEGTKVPMKVPCLTIKNTHPDFFWLTNFLETILSATLWQPCTSATIANMYRETFERYAKETGYDKAFIDWQAHDFSFRGMSSLESAISSGMGHLTSFKGTDTIPAIVAMDKYYASPRTEIIGGSVAATEHSVMCSEGREHEYEIYKRLITETYPTGIVSIVSDTYNLWDVITDMLPRLKEDILAREGRVVIRPDSGDPVDIICGKEIIDFTKNLYFSGFLSEHQAILSNKDIWKEFATYYIDDSVTAHGRLGKEVLTPVFKFSGKYYKMRIDIEWNRYDKQFYYIDDFKVKSMEEYQPTSEDLGVYELLWGLFGGTINEYGYKSLNTKIGVIYGDSITPERQKQILARLKAKGFTASNLVLGIGSYTYQYNTRDTFGTAMKATYIISDGVGRAIYKDPATDSGEKKSAKGLLKVVYDTTEHDLKLLQFNTKDEYDKDPLFDELQTVFIDGYMRSTQSLEQIRRRIGLYLI